MVQHAGACRLSEIDTDIETVRSVGLGQCGLGALNQNADFIDFLVRERAERREMTIGTTIR